MFLGFFQKVGEEMLPGDSSTLCYFWVPREEPPGGKLPTARRRMALYLVSGFSG